MPEDAPGAADRLMPGAGNLRTIRAPSFTTGEHMHTVRSRPGTGRLSLPVGLFMGAGTAAALANFVSWPVAALLGMASGGLGLLATVRWERRRERLAVAAAWAGVAVPQPGADGDVADESVLRMLDPGADVVRFNQLRHADVRALSAWVTAPDQAALGLLDGPAGEGKTRLLVELAAQLSDPWLVGWVRRGHGGEAVDVAERSGRPTLLIFEDAETRADILAASAKLVRTTASVKIVVAAREFDTWWIRLCAAAPAEAAGLLGTPFRHRIRPLVSDREQRQQVFAQALRSFARASGRVPPDASLAFGGTIESLVLIQAAAAVTVRHQLRGAVDLNTVLMSLFEEEHGYWQSRATQHGLPDVGLPVLQDAVVLAVLFGASSFDEAVELLRHVPGLAPAPAELLQQVALWLRGLYPGRIGAWLDPYLPARLVELYVVRHLRARPALTVVVAGVLARQTLTEAGPGPGDERVLRLLAEAAAHTPAAGDVLAELLGAQPALVVNAVQLAADGDVVLDAAVAAAVATIGFPADVLRVLYRFVPERRPTLRRTLAAIAGARVDAASGDDARAMRLTEFATHLADLGRHEEALAASTEAMTLHHRLADHDPGRRTTRAWASTKVTHANRLWAAGRTDEAEAATDEALAIYRPLAEQGLPDDVMTLAKVLNNAAGQQSVAGRNGEAIELLQESLQIRRRFAGAADGSPEPVAKALLNLAEMLGDAGRDDEALAAAEEAAALYRRLHAVEPHVHRRMLAEALIVAGDRHDEMRHHEDAVAALAEAVQLLRTLAEAEPALFQARLAEALGRLGHHLESAQRWQAAVEPRQQSVDLLRPLAVADAAVRRTLAGELCDLGALLGELGRPRGAAESLREAVSVLRRLPLPADKDQNLLAMALSNLGSVLPAMKAPLDEVLPLLHESVRIRRALVQHDPRQYEPGLATSLHNLGATLSNAGDDRNARGPAAEAVRIRRRLVRHGQISPDLLASSVDNLRRITGQSPIDRSVKRPRLMRDIDEGFAQAHESRSTVDDEV
jgi:tetratricopeptide (TPR) repeat protein